MKSTVLKKVDFLAGEHNFLLDRINMDPKWIYARCLVIVAVSLQYLPLNIPVLYVEEKASVIQSHATFHLVRKGSDAICLYIFISSTSLYNVANTVSRIFLRMSDNRNESPTQNSWPFVKKKTLVLVFCYVKDW